VERPKGPVLSRNIRLLLLLFALCGLATHAVAQRLPSPMLESIDVKVLRSSTIVIVSIDSVADAPKRRDREVRLSVKNTLRGAPGPTITGTTADISQLKVWQSKSASLLALKSGKSERIDLIDLLTASSANHYPEYARQLGELAPISTKNFEILKNQDAILSYARKLIRQSPAASDAPTMAIKPPPTRAGSSWAKALQFYADGGLIVPVDSDLEKLALASLKTLTRRNLYESIQMLRPFKSEKNIERMKKLLADPSYEVVIRADEFRGYDLREYLVRSAAVETLKHWGVDVPETMTREWFSRIPTLKKIRFSLDYDHPDISYLKDAKQLVEFISPWGVVSAEQLAIICSLSQLKRVSIVRARLDDSSLEKLATLRDLQYLNLDENAITDAGLKVVAKMAKLTEVSLGGTRVTPQGIAELQKARPNLKINLVIKDAEHRALARECESTADF
jgi:hypothetical protein